MRGPTFKILEPHLPLVCISKHQLLLGLVHPPLDTEMRSPKTGAGA